MKGRHDHEYDVLSFFGPQSFSRLVSEFASDRLNDPRDGLKAVTFVIKSICCCMYELERIEAQPQ